MNCLPSPTLNPGSYKVLGMHAANLVDSASSDLIFCYALAEGVSELLIPHQMATPNS